MLVLIVQNHTALSWFRRQHEWKSPPGPQIPQRNQTQRQTVSVKGVTMSVTDIAVPGRRV